MKISLPIEIEPFPIPIFVKVKDQNEEDGRKETKLTLGQLEPEDLSRLCDEFRKEVFNQAGKKDPVLPNIRAYQALERKDIGC